MTVFVDTSALLAVLNADDADYRQARRLWARLAEERAALVTTNYVLVETLALLQSRLGMTAVRDFQNAFVPLFQVIWVSEAQHQMGVSALLAANRRQLSLVDCVSFVVCRQFQIEDVLAFDQHFEEQGFHCLTA